jgi:hypothetical protein
LIVSSITAKATIFQPRCCHKRPGVLAGAIENP